MKGLIYSKDLMKIFKVFKWMKKILYTLLIRCFEKEPEMIFLVYITEREYMILKCKNILPEHKTIVMQ